MEYQQWRLHRDKILSQRPELIRLDCMNPFHAMARFKENIEPIGTLPPPKSNDSIPRLFDTLAKSFSKNLGFQLSTKLKMTTRGVRSFLTLFFEHCGDADRIVWLPDDVFPTYQALAIQSGWSIKTYSTLPSPNWNKNHIDASPTIAIVPIPLSPLGRDLSTTEIQFWLDWLEAQPTRVLILDTVYAYEPCKCSSLKHLRNHPQTIPVWSVSKSWIERGVYGFAEIDKTLVPQFRGSRLPTLKLDALSLPQLEALNRNLDQRPSLPQLQNVQFRKQWARFAGVLDRVDADWTAPTTGYFSTVRLSAETLLAEHNVLAVPASVFGSPLKDMSIISCLFGISHS